MPASEPGHEDAHRFAPAAPGEEHVFGSCSPGWHAEGPHETVVNRWIEDMLSHGIERVVCLLPGRELDRTGANVGLYRDAFGADAVRHAPIPDHRLAAVETLRADILPFLEQAVADDAPVVVHGLAGIGRTGQVLAAWLVSGRGYAPNEAVDTVHEMGRDPTEVARFGDVTRHDILALLADLQ
ncbi:MAG: protein phosphatase [Haloarculaceae archaeon]